MSPINLEFRFNFELYIPNYSSYIRMSKYQHLHVSATNHGGDLIHGLQELNNLGLVCRLHTGEEASTCASGLLLGKGQVVELSARVGLASCVFFLSEHSDTSADSFSGGLQQKIRVVELIQQNR